MTIGIVTTKSEWLHYLGNIKYEFITNKNSTYYHNIADISLFLGLILCNLSDRDCSWLDVTRNGLD